MAYVCRCDQIFLHDSPESFHQHLFFPDSVRWFWVESFERKAEELLSWPTVDYFFIWRRLCAIKPYRPRFAYS